MGNGSALSVQIYGQTYYFSDKDKYNEVVALQGDAAAQKTLVDNYQRQYGTSTVSTNEDDLTEFVEGEDKIAEEDGITVGSQKGLDVENYYAFADSTGLSSITEDSSVDDLINVFAQIEKSIEKVERAIRTLDTSSPENIDAVMSDIDILIESTATLGNTMGLNLPTSGRANNAMIVAGAGGAMAAGGAALAAGSAAALGTATLTIGTAALAVPGPGWVVAGACGLALIGIGIYNHFKNGEAEKKFTELEQNLKDASSKLQDDKDKVKDTIKGEIEENIISDVKEGLGDILTGQVDFNNIKDLSDITQNLGNIMSKQAEIENWAVLCEKYDIDIDGLEELRQALGSGDNMDKCANEYIESFVEYAKSNVNSTGEIVTDTGSFIASADEIQELVNAIAGDETISRLNYRPLLDLIEFIGQTNQEDVGNDAGAIGDGMHAGGTPYDFSGYSNAYNTAGENQTGVDGAASNGQYDVDTSQYEEVQKEAQEAAQKDVDEYLDNIKISGKTVEELEELYETTNSDLEEFSQYKENLNLDLSKFDTILADIRKEQQAQVDEYIDSIEFSGKSMSELEKLYDEVSGQGEAFKKASSEVDTSAFDDVLSKIRSEQQSIVDKYADEMSSRLESSASISQLATVSAEIDQFIGTVSEYNVNTGKVSALNSLAKEKIQEAVDLKAVNYEMKATTVQTSDDCIVLADIVNIEISQLQGTNADTSGLQKVAADLISKANILRIEEAKKKAEEDAMNVPATMPPAGTTESTNGAGTSGANEGQTPVTIPSFADDGIAAYNPENPPVADSVPPAADGETPVAGEEPPVADGDAADGKPPVENGENIVPPAVEGMEPSGGEPAEPSGEPETPVVQEPAGTNGGQTETEQPPATETGDGETPPAPAVDPAGSDVKVNTGAEETGALNPGEVISVGQADETTPPPLGADETETETEGAASVEEKVEHIVKEGVKEGKPSDEIADLIEIEVEE